MSKKNCFKVSPRPPRFREDTSFMRAHETMVDIMKGNVTGSFMDMLGGGIFGFLHNLELDEERDLYYSDEDDDEWVETPELRPHPRIKELDDEEAYEQIKKSVEEQEKRKSKTVRNKRKKMRKKEKKQQEKVAGDKKVSPDKDQEKSHSSESEEENNSNISNCTELDTSVTDVCDEPDNLEINNKIIKEESSSQLNQKTDDPPKNLDLKKSAPCNTEPALEKTTRLKTEKIAKAQTTQNKKAEKVQQNKKEEPKEENSVKAEEKNEEKGAENQKEVKLDESKKESTDPNVDEYAKKSREMAAVGNHMAASGQYEMAIKCFTEALKLTPKEYKLFGNRSFCFEKLQQFEEALSDADVSLSLEPNWTKGLFRKGKAQCGLKKYYEASVTFSEVLKTESTSPEAIMELKRAQTLHLMEMGFSWAQSTNALKSHLTLEEAIDALFTEELQSTLQESGACKIDQFMADQACVEESEWEQVQMSTRPKQQMKEKAELQYPPKKQKPGQLFPVWVGSLSPTVSYVTLHKVFSRVGKVFSINMVLEHQCAFVNYTSKTECEQAIQLLNGMVLEGRPLSVRFPSRVNLGVGVSRDAEMDPLTPACIKTECFFWRTSGCTKDVCTFKHIPKNKGIDQDKFSIKFNQQ